MADDPNSLVRATTPPSYRPENRALGLDVLRFVAVTLVIFRHADRYRAAPGSGPLTRAVAAASHALQNAGWIGVDLFFVLSGFLVSGLIFRDWQAHGHVSLGRFLVRRALKIYPAFWFFLLVMSAYFELIHHAPVSLGQFASEFFFVQNYGPHLFNHTWSLAVEEHFYLLCAAGAAWLLRPPRRGTNPFQCIPAVFLFLAVVCLGARLVSGALYPAAWTRLILVSSHLRLDSLFFGVLLAYLWHFHYAPRGDRRLHRFRHALVFLGVLLLLPFTLGDPYDPALGWIRTFGPSLAYLAGGALLFGFLKIFEGTRAVLSRLLGFLGRYSYSTYLWHQQSIALGRSFLRGHELTVWEWLLESLLVNLGAWVVGVLMAHVVEFPVLKLRDRLFPSRAAGRLRD